MESRVWKSMSNGKRTNEKMDKDKRKEMKIWMKRIKIRERR